MRLWSRRSRRARSRRSWWGPAMRAELSTIHPTTEAAPRRRLYVGSEVGVLRRVILHRPDLELKRLTPHNKDALLFDDVLWVRRARQEHDAFADALADRGVEVLYLERLPTCPRTTRSARRCCRARSGPSTSARACPGR